jgi:hypothetical protein
MEELVSIIREYEQECFHKPKLLKLDGGTLTLHLYPLTKEMWVDKENYLKTLIANVKNDSGALFRTIVCSTGTLREILRVAVIDFMVFFVLPQRLPSL